jgi:putative transposase
MIVPGDNAHRFVIHDRDAIGSEGVDRTPGAMSLIVLKTPVPAPQANACCERLMGTIRRECLDFLIPLNESHVRSLLKAWVTHDNQGRPHASLGPGIPDPPDRVLTNAINHRIPSGHRVVAMPILAGLHHEYRLEANAA